jgi:hypothetical protein
MDWLILRDWLFCMLKKHWFCLIIVLLWLVWYSCVLLEPIDCYKYIHVYVYIYIWISEVVVRVVTEVIGVVVVDV